MSMMMVIDDDDVGGDDAVSTHDRLSLVQRQWMVIYLSTLAGQPLTEGVPRVCARQREDAIGDFCLCRCLRFAMSLYQPMN